LERLALAMLQVAPSSLAEATFRPVASRDWDSASVRFWAARIWRAVRAPELVFIELTILPSRAAQSRVD
jgi:hypothetical protein